MINNQIFGISNQETLNLIKENVDYLTIISLISINNFFFGRHSEIEPTNEYHEHTHARPPPRQYRASNLPLSRPGLRWTKSPTTVFDWAGAALTGPTQRLGTPRILKLTPLAVLSAAEFIPCPLESQRRKNVVKI